MLRVVQLVVLSLTTVLISGCGKRGLPLPPEPAGPQPARTVDVAQRGELAVIEFVLPAPRGPKPSQILYKAELIRLVYPRGRDTTFDINRFARRAEPAGELRFSDPEAGKRMRMYDSTLLDNFEEGSTFRYALRLVDRKNRKGPWVLAENLVPTTPLPPVEGLTAEAVADGVFLSWNAVPDGAYHVYRKSTSDSVWSQTPLGPGPISTGEFLDRTVTTGESYEFMIRTTIDGEPPFRESEDSAVVTITAKDLYPPEPPTGLIAVQEGMAVRLFWDPNEERDLRGYHVYRRVDSEVFQRQTDNILQGTLFLDQGVRQGQKLEYQVTAVDQATPPNESAPSTTVRVEIRDQFEPVQEPDR